ncbi:unnamed protein product, partial [Coccothraustes coccothraustes]
DWRVTVPPLQRHWTNQQSIKFLLLHKGMQNNVLFTESLPSSAADGAGKPIPKCARNRTIFHSVGQ